MRLWDLATGEGTRSLEGHTDRVNGVAFSPDGRTLASASGDGTVRLWDLERLAAVAQVALGSPVPALAWNEGGIAVGTGQGEVAMLMVIDRDRPAPETLHNPLDK